MSDKDIRMKIKNGIVDDEIADFVNDSLKWYKDHAKELGVMDWQDIVFQLLDDPMIKSCGCDGLLDANRVLTGLLGMSEIMHSSEYFNNAFILEALNASINARNRYCSLNGAEKLPLVKWEDYNFIWEGISK